MDYLSSLLGEAPATVGAVGSWARGLPLTLVPPEDNDNVSRLVNPPAAKAPGEAESTPLRTGTGKILQTQALPRTSQVLMAG